MKQQQYVRVSARPGKAGSAILVVMGVLFFAFGTLLTGMADTEGEAELALLVWFFRIIWWAACVSMIVFGVLGLTRTRGPVMAEFDVDQSWSQNDIERQMREQAANSSNARNIGE